jgi:type III restriction enzyme
MDNRFFEQPILNSPYEYSRRQWKLDPSGQPTGDIEERRRRADFITPIPKPKKHKKAKAAQEEIVFDEVKNLSTGKQQYDPTSIINEVRQLVYTWRALPASQWQVSPETARLLHHWRTYTSGIVRSFFCQIEAVEISRALPSGLTFPRSTGSLIGCIRLNSVRWRLPPAATSNSSCATRRVMSVVTCSA